MVNKFLKVLSTTIVNITLNISQNSRSSHVCVCVFASLLLKGNFRTCSNLLRTCYSPLSAIFDGIQFQRIRNCKIKGACVLSITDSKLNIRKSYDKMLIAVQNDKLHECLFLTLEGLCNQCDTLFMIQAIQGVPINCH